MKFKRKISKWGGSVGVSLPRDLLQYLGLDPGDDIIITDHETEAGKYIIIRKSHDADTEPAEQI